MADLRLLYTCMTRGCEVVGHFTDEPGHCSICLSDLVCAGGHDGRTWRYRESVRFLQGGLVREPSVTGNCAVREHTGDGAYVGRCCFALYEGYCQRHGYVAGLTREQSDDRLLPSPESRDFGSKAMRKFLGKRP